MIRFLRQRLFRHWRLKLVLSIVMPLVFVVGYVPLQHHTFFPVRTFELTWLDRMIGFDPRWIYAYQSLYLLMPVAPLLVADRRDLTRYLRAFLVICGISFAIFFFFPVLSPRPEGLTGVTAFDQLTSIEGRLNAFPSLHAGLATYALFFTHAFWRKERARDRAIRRFGGWFFWVVAVPLGCVILYATLATKQHYAVDLPAGMFLAWLGHRLNPLHETLSVDG